MTMIKQSLLLVSLFLGAFQVMGYPMIAEIPEDDQRCIRFNIPKDDDAHMIFVAIPSSDSQKIEEWFVQQVYDMTRTRAVDGSIPKRFTKTPDNEIQQEMEKLTTEVGRRSSIILKIEKPNTRRPLRQQQLGWFVPSVLNHVERFQKAEKAWDPQSAEGYSICFNNESDEEQVNVIFEIVLVSEPMGEDLDSKDGSSVQKEQLTPLEEQLSASIYAANSIMNEMRYMEKREARMRLTADSINSRIRIFSYISVAILLTVTYLQVTYLKRYFKKKKLM